MTTTPVPPEDDPHGILAFWIDEVGPKGWFAVDPALDAEIRDRYLALWEAGRAGGLDNWRTAARPCLALVILLDQFPRNMFRGDPRSFASDAKARAVAKSAIDRRQDTQVDFPARGFFYLPLTHSEVLADQEQGVRRVLLAGASVETLLHARAHREIIRRFGRFPFRNAALGRSSTPDEEAFLAAGGYSAALAELSS